MIEGQDGLNWDRWKRLAQAAEDLGFAGLYRSDHFTNPSGPHLDAIDLWTSLSYLAATTTRIEFGPMVSPVSFRNPVWTAWTAAAVDDLSGGRLHLGLGAGWQVREHESFGFDLLEVGPRFDRFEEGLQVVLGLLRNEEPFDFEGSYFNLSDALLMPRPNRPGGPPIVIGGNGPQKTLPLAARYADEWNAVFVVPERYAELSGQLSQLAETEDRDPASIKRTLMHRLTIGATSAEVGRKTAALDVEDLLKRGALVGTPDQIVAGIKAFEAVGVERLMAQWIDMDDIDGLQLLAEEVLPNIG